LFGLQSEQPTLAKPHVQSARLLSALLIFFLDRNASQKKSKNAGMVFLNLSN
jgi:hypothetical protein